MPTNPALITAPHFAAEAVRRRIRARWERRRKLTDTPPTVRSRGANGDYYVLTTGHREDCIRRVIQGDGLPMFSRASNAEQIKASAYRKVLLRAARTDLYLHRP